MPQLLVIQSAIPDEASRTRALTRTFIEAWRARGPEFEVATRDLGADPLSHLRERTQHLPERLRDGAPLAPETDALQAQVIGELTEADAVFIGAPMYNFGVPSTLKSWIDLVFVPGLTAPFDVAVQPFAGKPVVIATSRGAAPDERTGAFVTGPLTEIFGEMCGMDVHVVEVARTLADVVPALGVEEAAAEIARAESELRRLGSELLTA